MINEAKFLTSNTLIAKCPPPDKPEYAFIGRSNVGKSSLINMLTGRKNLAKISSRPGKTQLINHFLINNNWYLVDLPGYGYAKVTKTAKEAFQKLITNYILQRENLYCLFVLIDIRHEALKIDIDFMNWLGKNQIPFSIVFTKADKLGKTGIDKNINTYQKALKEYWEELPPIFVSSALNEKGKEEIINFIEEINSGS